LRTYFNQAKSNRGILKPPDLPIPTAHVIPTEATTWKEKKNFGSNLNQKNDDLNQKRLVQITNQVGTFGSHLVQI
jgi:uncharacterized protein YaaR (DUF327 family)